MITLAVLGFLLGIALSATGATLAAWSDSVTPRITSVRSGLLDLDLLADLNWAYQDASGIWRGTDKSILNQLHPGTRVRGAASFRAEQVGNDLLSLLEITPVGSTQLFTQDQGISAELAQTSLAPIRTALYVGAFSAYHTFPATPYSNDLSTATNLAQSDVVVYTLLSEWQIPLDYQSGNSDFLEQLMLVIPQYMITLAQREISS